MSDLGKIPCEIEDSLYNDNNDEINDDSTPNFKLDSNMIVHINNKLTDYDNKSTGFPQIKSNSYGS